MKSIDKLRTGIYMALRCLVWVNSCRKYHGRNALVNYGFRQDQQDGQDFTVRPETGQAIAIAGEDGNPVEKEDITRGTAWTSSAFHPPRSGCMFRVALPERPDKLSPA